MHGRYYTFIIIMQTGRERIEPIIQRLQVLGGQLTERFRNSEAQIAADAVINLYQDVRKEDEMPKERGADVNETKRLLNQAVKRIIEDFFAAFVVPNLNRVEHSTNMDFLNVLLNNWTYIKVFAMVYKFILSKHQNHYMHAQEIKEDCYSVPQMVLHRVNIDILQKYNPKVINIINETFQKERNQENTEKEKVKELISIIENCGLEKLSDVEASFRTKTIEFTKYKPERNERTIITTMDPHRFFAENYFPYISDDCVASYKRRISQLPNQPSEYIAQVIKIMKSERERAEYYFFDDHFKNLYLTEIEKELVDKRIIDILSQDNGIQTFIDISSEKDLSGTYSLCKRRFKSTFPFLQKQLETYFINAGKRISHAYQQSEKRDAILYVDSMISLKKKFNEIVDVFFKKDLEFIKLRNVVCKDILRYEGDDKPGLKKVETMGAKNLAQYTNAKLKECAKLDAADKIEEILNNIILIFESLMAQHKYLAEHQVLMSKRLLEPYNSKPNSDIERLLIRKLEHIIGSTDVNKHIGMLKDYEYSQDFESKLNDKLEGTKVRVQPFILQNDSWPDNEDVDIVFPNALIVEKSKVEAIYTAYSQGKCLIWKVNRGVSQLQAKFKDNTYRFVINNLMMFILLHINEGTNRSILFGDLKQKFRLKRMKAEDEGGSNFNGEFRLNLLSLVEHKLVLRAKGVECDIGEGESFEINPNYVYVPPRQEQEKKQTKMKTNVTTVTLLPSNKLKNELKVGSVNTTEIIRKERNLKMDAAVVQLMKHYNTIEYDGLIPEIRNHRELRNMDLKLSEIKERIEHLITHNYMDRDETNRNKLVYKS